MVLAVDSSKFDKFACMTVCSVDEVDTILSDDKMSKEEKEKYEKRGVEVITP